MSSINPSTLPLPYKIISSSSQSHDSPISNLLLPNSLWQSSRFCTFPQQITLRFSQPQHITKLQFLSHRYMIPNRIQILYLNTQQQQHNGKQQNNLFERYGYVRFSSNQETGFEAREQKTLDVDFICNHLRLLLHKPFENRMNYFSQVGLEEVVVFDGSGNGQMRMLESQSQYQAIGEQGNKMSASVQQRGQLQEQSMAEKVKLLEEKKQMAVGEQRYDEAQKIKDIISNIYQLSEQLKFMGIKKVKVVELQNYDQAKKIKNQIQRIKKSRENIIKNCLDGNHNYDQKKEKYGSSFDNNHSSKFNKSYDRRDNQNEGQPEIEQEIDQRQDHNQFVEQIEEISYINQSKHKTNNDKQSRRGKQSRAFIQSYQQQIPYQREIINYDERVLPAILNKNKPQPEQDEFQTKLPEQPQQLDSKSVKQQQISSIFGEDTTRRFFSKYWQFRLQALNTITEQLQTPNLTKDKSLPLRNSCYLKIILDGIKSNVFQICQISLQLFTSFINNKQVEHNKSQIEYDNILYELTKRLSDGNLKIRQLAEKLFKTMAKLPLYGVGICSSMLIKTVTPNSKLSNLQIQQRLDFLILFINESGLGQGNVPMSSIEFAIGYVYYQFKEIRNSAIDLLVVCYLSGSTGEEKVRVALEKLKKETAEQIYRKINQVEKDREGDKPKQNKSKVVETKNKDKEKEKQKEKEKLKSKNQSETQKKMSQSSAQKGQSKPKPKPTKDKVK